MLCVELDPAEYVFIRLIREVPVEHSIDDERQFEWSLGLFRRLAPVPFDLSAELRECL
jgi:hypothetical protein